MNVLGMLNLADICNTAKIHLTTYATGCIFHYDKDFPENSGKGFKEDDTPNFTGSYYSYTKVSTGPYASCGQQIAGQCQQDLHAALHAGGRAQQACLVITAAGWLTAQIPACCSHGRHPQAVQRCA